MNRVFRRAATIALGLCLALSAGATWAQDEEQSPENPMNPRILLETSMGDILIELNGEKAPISTMNFVKYVEAGFYNGTIFHRVMPAFMIQGGGFSTDYTRKREGLRGGIQNEWENGLKNARGTIAMARTEDPNSGTSQFFINVVDNARLDLPQDGAAYAVFGKVIEGMDAVDKIKAVATGVDSRISPKATVPVEVVEIKSAKLVSKFEKRAEVEAAITKLTEDAEAPMNEHIAKLEESTGKKFERSESGLAWIVLKEGTGTEHPVPSDNITIHYTGWLTDGTEFDSSTGGDPATFPLRTLIRGWIEGLGLMVVGEKRKFVIPPELGYGPDGNPPRIPGNAVLEFDIELFAINK